MLFRSSPSCDIKLSKEIKSFKGKEHLTDIDDKMKDYARPIKTDIVINGVFHSNAPWATKKEDIALPV